MIRALLAAVALTIVLPAHAQTTGQEEKLAAEIKGIDQAELAAFLAKDIPALEKYWSEDFTVNAPTNQILKGKEVFELLRNGVIDYASYERQVEAVLLHGDIAILMGSETVKPRAKAPAAEQTIRRRSTNIWRKRDGKWQLIARHASVIPPTEKAR